MSQTDKGYVKQTFLKKGLLQITFFHPKHNSLPGNLLAELKSTIDNASDNDEVQVIILQSGGDRTFCAGASFEELLAVENPQAGKIFFMGFAGVINACRKCSKLIIGRIQGKAVGGGVGVASAVDYCLATKYAAVKLSELNLGIGPFVIGPVVTRKIGISAMSQLAINANTFQSADWAKEKGLYADVFEDAESLNKAVMELADYLINTNPEARELLKKMFWEDCDNWDQLLESRAEMSGRLVVSDYTKNALGAYR